MCHRSHDVSAVNPTTAIRTFAYTNLGNGPHILQVRAASGGATVDAFITSQTVIRYTYDPLSRLTSATYSGDYTYTFAYAYDAVGNPANYGQGYSRIAQTQTITSTQVTNYIYDAANRLTSVNGQAYTWDDNGNLVSDGDKTYTYDQANRLTAVSSQSSAVAFAYNGEGARLKQVVNGSPTTYTLDLAAPLVQVLVAKDSSGDTRYLYGVTRIGEQQSAGWVYHLSDALGSVRQLADANAQVVLTRGYTPYGEPLWSEGTGQSAYGFTGEPLDVSTGLVFLRARYMQPALGIFLARDPWSGNNQSPSTLNDFAYVSGDPINDTDPTGLFDLRTVGTSLGYNDSAPLENVVQSIKEWYKNKYGWVQLLLDAMPGDKVTFDTYIPGPGSPRFPTSGVVTCQDGAVMIDGRKAYEFADAYFRMYGLGLQTNSDLSTWGSVVVYSLNDRGPIFVGLLGRSVYADWRGFRSLPDYQILFAPGVSISPGPVGVSGQVVFVLDRFGNYYNGGELGLGVGLPGIVPIAEATAMGGGYIGWNLDIFNFAVLDEAHLIDAISGATINVTANGLIVQLSGGITANFKYWNYYFAYGGFTPGLTASAQTMSRQFKNEGWGWDRLEHGLSGINSSGPAAQFSCGCR